MARKKVEGTIEVEVEVQMEMEMMEVRSRRRKYKKFAQKVNKSWPRLDRPDQKGDQEAVNRKYANMRR